MSLGNLVVTHSSKTDNKIRLFCTLEDDEHNWLVFTLEGECVATENYLTDSFENATKINQRRMDAHSAQRAARP